MHCPRIKHFIRLNRDGTIGKCGHMVNPPGFESYKDLVESRWLKKTAERMDKDEWPDECVRCQRTEKTGGKSIRLASIDRHRLLKPLHDDYIIVGGVLDNICNSACQTCNAGLSTKIGSLESKKYLRVDNYKMFWQLPQHRIVEVDVSGGEPTASKNYKQLLSNLPDGTKIVRMNTNGSRMIDELENVLMKGVKVIVTLSLDGLHDTHDYVRWPIKWEQYEDTLNKYMILQKKYKLLNIDTWTTVSCLNIMNLPDIMKYTSAKGLQHNWSFLEYPDVLNVKYENRFTARAKHLYPEQIAIEENNDDVLSQFVEKQDLLRDIDINDYLK